jgi:O-antigen biosynthesis protein WbqP
MTYHYGPSRSCDSLGSGTAVTTTLQPLILSMLYESNYPLKRVIDVVASFLGLLVLAPFLLCVALLVRATSPGPALFWSERVGRYGKAFMMPKFRSMKYGTKVQAREATSGPNDELSPIGLFLRKLSIDELPQLWCVLCGDMSLVGPRPLLPNDPTTRLRQDFFPVCFLARPGITGLAQVNGRNRMHGARKARYDAYYARYCSLKLDWFIMMRTAKVLFNFDDII